MQERRARLSRIVSLLTLQKALSEARLSRLAQEEALLSAREHNLISLIGLGGPLGETGSRALARTAHDRQDAAVAREIGEAERIGAERRERASRRALSRIEAGIEDQALRRALEEIRLKPPQVSGKFTGTKS